MDTYSEADYFPILRWSLGDVRILSEGFSADQILEFMERSEYKLIVLYKYNMFLATRLQLGLWCALTLSLRKPSVRMTGQWENVIWKITELAVNYKISHANNINLHTLELLERTTLKPWILRIFRDPEFCPNPYLRLKMIDLITIWPKNFLQDATSGMQAAAGLLLNSKYMDPEHLTVHYFSSLTGMLKSLEEYGHLAAIAAAADDQVTRITVGPEVSLLYNLMKVLRQMAETILNGKETYGLYMTNMLFRSYVCLLVELRTTKKAYTAPGLAKIAADILVTFTVSIFTIGSKFQDTFGGTYRSLVSQLNNIYEEISKDKVYRSVYQVLRLNHAQHLSSLSKKGADSDCFFHHFLVPFQGEAPEVFRDSVTQEVMQSPVLLHSSNMVVDESTLLRLLLESPSDPFTRRPLDRGSYSRLPHLRAAILAWMKD